MRVEKRTAEIRCALSSEAGNKVLKRIGRNTGVFDDFKKIWASLDLSSHLNRNNLFLVLVILAMTKLIGFTIYLTGASSSTSSFGLG